jgi:hypothetical protein
VLEAEQITKRVIESGQDAYENMSFTAENTAKELGALYNELFLGAESAEEREALFNDESLIPDENTQAIAATSYVEAQMAAINEEKWEDLDAAAVEDYSKHL